MALNRINTNDIFEYKKYLGYTRLSVAVHCWFPSGNKTEPIITMIKFKEPEGDIITIRDIYNQYSEQSCYSGDAIVEFQCQILYVNRKRSVVLFYYPKDLKWEMTFLN